MRFVVIFAVLFLCLVFAATPKHQSWEYFKQRHQKKYSSVTEEVKRHNIFNENMKAAQQLEAQNPKSQFGASPFADLTAAEFKNYHNGDAHFQKQVSNGAFAKKYTSTEVAAIPDSVDWRKKGAVTNVKNQGQCGSCWSFSTTGGIEGQWFLAGHTLTSLSEQELVSCDTIDSGCNGGLMNNAYDWLLGKKNGSLVTEDSYPYVSGDGMVPKCNLGAKTFGAQIAGHENILHDEHQMAAWTSEHGPLSIAVDATAWQLYFGGVMTTCGGSSLDHGVLIVGYDKTASTPYWIIKNSWGADWGEQGYIWVSMFSNQCLLTHYPVSSIVGKAPPSPPRPTPIQAGYFMHSVFDDAQCSEHQWDLVWRQGECVSWDGVSFKATCTKTDVQVTAYPSSTDCSGSTYSVKEEFNQCVTDNADFAYYKNSCPMEMPPRNILTEGRTHDASFSTEKAMKRLMAKFKLNKQH